MSLAMTRSRALRNPATLFALTSLLIVALEIAIATSQRFVSHVDIGSWAVTCDLTITIPAIYYFMVIRRGRARAITIAPLFIACAFLASMIVPRDHQQFLHQLRLVTAPLDLLTIVLVVQRIRAMRRSDSHVDAHTKIERAVQAVFGATAIASFVVIEISILYHALFCWRRKPQTAEGATAVTVHERVGWSTIVAAILIMIGAESIGLHLLLAHWSTKAAWTLTALDIYGALWLIGDYHALRLRRTMITNDAIELRYGLRWTATIARDNIASIESIRSESDWKHRGTLKMAIFDEPRTLIRLREPVVAHGLAGITKRIDAIAILPDDETSFEAALTR